MKKRLNMNTVRHFLGDIPGIDKSWSDTEAIRSDWGWVFDTFVEKDGFTFHHQNPRRHGGFSRLCLHFLKGNSLRDDISRSSIEMQVQVPLGLLRKPKEHYSLYNIRFWLDPDSGLSEEDTLPFRIGYYGITSRHPIERFREHQREMGAGKGYLFHSAWRSLVAANITFGLTLQICGSANTLAEIYDLEEAAVRKYSLVPNGLNAIPGGMEGIRRLHELRLLGSPTLVDPSIRDAATAELETDRGSARAHYRTGHIRRLSSKRVTWVRPCWVNLDKVAA